MLRFKFRSIVVASLRRLMPILAAAALVLGPTAAHADLGDQLAKLLPDDGAFEHHFGNSVAIDGEIVVVGAPWDDYNGYWTGSAYLFDTTTGTQIAKLLPDDGAQGDLFGNSVGVRGITAVVGAHQNDIYGSAYLFDTSAGQQLAKLSPDDGPALLFGFSVAISDGTAIVGAYGDDSA